MKRYLLLLCMTCLLPHLGFAQDKEVKAAVKQINSIKSDSKYLYAESTTKDWDQAYEDAKALLIVEIENWIKSQGNKNEDIKGYVARIENNFMEVKTRRGNLFRVFVYIKKKNIMTYNEDMDVTVNSLGTPSDEPPVKLKDSEITPIYTIDSKEANFVALSKSDDIQRFLKEYAGCYAKLSTMSKQQDCYVMLFSQEKVERHFKFVASEGKVLNLDTLQYENIDAYKGHGYGGIWFKMK